MIWKHLICVFSTRASNYHLLCHHSPDVLSVLERQTSLKDNTMSFRYHLFGEGNRILPLSQWISCLHFFPSFPFNPHPWWRKNNRKDRCCCIVSYLYFLFNTTCRTPYQRPYATHPCPEWPGYSLLSPWQCDPPKRSLTMKQTRKFTPPRLMVLMADQWYVIAMLSSSLLLSQLPARRRVEANSLTVPPRSCDHNSRSVQWRWIGNRVHRLSSYFSKSDANDKWRRIPFGFSYFGNMLSTH